MDINTNNELPCSAEENKGTNVHVQLQNNIRVAMLGNVDSGKSTTTAVLVSKPGELDDGRGSLRKNVFNYQHEVANGRTASIGHEIMGFMANGEQYVTKFDHTTKKNKIWPDIVENSVKIVHLLDMCGHEKYLKTTMHGLNSLYPDYAMLFIGGNMGVSRMTMEHLFIAITLDLPVFVVFTKTDIAPQQVLAENIKKISNALKQHCSKIPILVKGTQNAGQLAEKVKSGKVTPIFTISNHTGEGVEALRGFISKLEKTERKMIKDNVKTHESITTQFVIDDSYQSKGLGLIFCGTVLKGDIEIDQNLMFGPDRNGNFKAVKVKGIHENRVPINEASEGMQVTLKLKQIGKTETAIQRDHIRKGSFLINPIEKKVKGQNPYHEVCSKYFIAKIKIKNHHTTIQGNYSAVMHLGGVRQSVQIVKIKNNDCLRIGDTGEVLFKLQYGVEIISIGEKLLLREGATRAVGYISETFPLNTPADELVDHFIE